MESLYSQAAYCVRGEEKVAALLESVREQTDARANTLESVREQTVTNPAAPTLLEFATTLSRQAVFELQTRAVEVDALLEAGHATTTPFVSALLATLETLDKQFPSLLATDGLMAALKTAAQTGDEQLVDLCLLLGVDPSANNNCAIGDASYNGHLSVVNRLLQDPRVDPSADDNNAIIGACQYGHLPVVDRLLQDDRVDPSALKNTALHEAVTFGHVSVVDRLLQESRVTPSTEVLWLAALQGHLSVVDRLLQDARVDPSAYDESSPLQVACERGHLPIVERLLQESRVDPTLDDNHAIRMASDFCQISVVKRLLQDARVVSTLSEEELAAYRTLL